MRIFAQQKNQPQQKPSAGLARSNRLAPSAGHEAHPLLHLQRTLGNRAVQRLQQDGLNSPTAMKIQRQLAVSTPGDTYEQEADDISEQVMLMPEQPSLEFPRVQTKHVDRSDAGQTTAPPIVNEVLASSGQALDRSVRGVFEARFGHDFSQVRVHSGPLAEQSARDLNASAYTVGHNIVFGVGRFAPGTPEGRRLIAHELSHVLQQQHGDTSRYEVQRQPDSIQRTPKSKTAGIVLRAKDLLAQSYPHLATVLDAQQVNAIQEVIDWRLHSRKVDEEVEAYDRREREKSVREGSGYSYRILSSYNDQIERINAKRRGAPDVEEIQVDTSKLIDPAILDEQDWNVDAERQFRERWVQALASKPTSLYLWGNHPIEDMFRGIYWNNVALPTEGGLVTWQKLLKIPGAWSDYHANVLNSPIAMAAQVNLKHLAHWHSEAEREYESGLEHKRQFPVVSWVAELLSSSIDWNAAAKFLPPGQSFDGMSFYEQMKFLGSIKEDQVDKIKRELPSRAEVAKVRGHVDNLDVAVALRKYEAALMTMPLVADEIEEMLRRVYTYEQRTLEGASAAITGLQAVRTGCSIVLTVGGGVAGKAYGLIGISAGSAAGAGVGTLTQETAMQFSEDRFDPGSILWKSGKDAALTFIGSMIGGALASKFQGLLSVRLEKVISNESVRTFVISRAADATSGVLTTPIEIVVDGMVEGDWPKDMDDLLGRVADNVAAEVVTGGILDAVTAVPGLKGKAFDAMVTEHEIDTALKRGFERGDGDLVQSPARHFKELERLGADPATREKLFADAKDLRDRQNAFAEELLGGLGMEKGQAGSILKREELDELIAGLRRKATDKNYTGVVEMPDIVRGRFNLPDEQSVLRVVSALNTQTKFPVLETVAPRRKVDGGFGYPRYHVVVMDPKTGLPHEWQVGTAATTRLFETRKVPLDGFELPKGMNPDLHDVEYDIFRVVEEKYPQMARQLGIKEFRTDLDLVAAETGRIGNATLESRMQALYDRAGKILRQLVDLNGADWLKQFAKT